MGNESSYVLAMYDIRGKQEFIYRSNRLKEIVGGSAIIRDCFKNYLYPVAETIGEKKGIYPARDTFSRELFEEHIREGYLGEVVYEGGGNFLLLFKDEETFKEVTYLFTKKLLEEVGTLRVLGTCISDVNFDLYESERDENGKIIRQGDKDRLYAEHRKNEGMESNISPWGTLPIVQVDRRTYMPLVDTIHTQGGKMEKVSKESKAKYAAYEKECKDKPEEVNEMVLDNMILQKGEDSLLAIIYIDGNNMGAQVQEHCKGKFSYEDCVNALRVFSKEIQENYIDNRKVDIDRVLKEKHQKDKKNNNGKRRLVIGAGDEMNLICNAHDAFTCAREYISTLPKGCSSCVGIAVFHSHAPYADVYRIAEECCESGKKWMKEHKVNHASLLDFHYCQGAIGVSLEDIRCTENTMNCSRPWLLSVEEDEKEKAQDSVDVAAIDRVKEILNTIGRTNVKTLVEAAKNDEIQYKLEIQRINAHMSEDALKKIHATSIFELNEKRQMVYDMGIVYDIWFKEQ